MAGLKMTMPAGWSIFEHTPGNLGLVPPGQPNDQLDFSLDMTAVKSSGAGHGTTILKNVGTTPSALVAWLTHDPDFLIVTKPVSATVGLGIKMTSLVVGVSRSANYGDPGCPANPRCADLFTNQYFNGNFVSIGGDEEQQLYLGSVKINGSPHTFLITLDAVNNADLQRLEKAAAPIIASLRLPPGAVAD